MNIFKIFDQDGLWGKVSVETPPRTSQRAARETARKAVRENLVYPRGSVTKDFRLVADRRKK
jgi:hypothetical protein